MWSQQAKPPETAPPKFISRADLVLVPVVVTERCGIAPLLRDRAALVVPCEVEALRTALVRLIGDQDLRDRLRAGTVEVRRELTWDEPVAQMERLYMECIEARRSSGR